MSVVIGTLLLSMGVALYRWSFIQYRRPNPAPWTHWEFPMQILIFVNLAALAFGMAYLCKFIATIVSATPSVAEFGIAVAILAALALTLRILSRQWQRFAGGTAATVEPFPRPDPNSGAPSTPPRSKAA